MKSPRSTVRVSSDGSPREFLAVAVRIVAATGGKDGFFIQLFPDMRGPQAIYVSIPQLEHLVALAETSLSDAEVWTELAKIPLEPLAPARSLYPRLRSLLVDCAQQLRNELAGQRDRAEMRARAIDATHAEHPPAPSAEAPRPARDPDAL